MRNGNRFRLYTSSSPYIVLTVPMRNGNLSSCVRISSYASVLTVPMRNGNKELQAQLALTETTVLTVPMRNGNHCHRYYCGVVPKEFLPYL